MTKTAMILNPNTLEKTLSAAQKKRKMNISYHVARQFEDKGLLAPVFTKPNSGRGRAKKSYELTKQGETILNRVRKAHEKYEEEIQKIKDTLQQAS